jgi:hypothetical protein
LNLDKQHVPRTCRPKHSRRPHRLGLTTAAVSSRARCHPARRLFALDDDRLPGDGVLSPRGRPDDSRCSSHPGPPTTMA